MKVSLIAEGGGIKASYAVGVIDALYSKLGLRRVDYVTGSSASTGTLAYFASGQFYPGIYIWTKELTSSKFLSLRNLFSGKPYLNVDYVVDKIFKENIPLDSKKLRNSKVKFFVPVTNSITGKVKYFNNKQDVDIFEVLRASMASPIVYGKNVKINNKTYFDGGFSDPLPVNIPEIKNSKKIIILTNSEDFRLKSNPMERIFLELNRPFLKTGIYKQIHKKTSIYEKRLNEIDKLEKKGDIVLRLNESIHKYDNSLENIKKGIKLGRRDALSNEKLISFINELRESSKRKFYFNV